MERIEEGEFTLGKEVVEKEYTQFSVTPQSTLIATKSRITARKIPLTEIRRKLLHRHETLGLVRANNDQTELT